MTRLTNHHLTDQACRTLAVSDRNMQHLPQAYDQTNELLWLYTDPCTRGPGMQMTGDCHLQTARPMR